MLELNAINEFIRGSVDLVIAAKDYRYSEGWVAFVSHEHIVGELASSYDTLNGICHLETWGLSAIEGWYPVAFGGTVGAAMVALNSNLEKSRAHWDKVRVWITKLAFEGAPSYEKTCKAVTLDQLLTAYERWNTGADDPEPPILTPVSG